MRGSAEACGRSPPRNQPPGPSRSRQMRRLWQASTAAGAGVVAELGDRSIGLRQPGFADRTRSPAGSVLSFALKSSRSSSPVSVRPALRAPQPATCSQAKTARAPDCLVLHHRVSRNLIAGPGCSHRPTAGHQVDRLAGVSGEPTNFRAGWPHRMKGGHFLAGPQRRRGAGAELVAAAVKRWPAIVRGL